MQYIGPLYRALNPVRAYEPLSGEGARRYGGRFNPRGMAALYLSFSPLTAIREANQAGTLQPTVIVQYSAEIDVLFDARGPAALAQYGMQPEDIARDDWRLIMGRGHVAPGQSLARQLVSDGFTGLVTPSFAPGVTPGEHNLVLWSWGDRQPSRLVVVDDEGRLMAAPQRVSEPDP